MRFKQLYIIFLINCLILSLYADRIVSVGSGITEIIYALGAESNLVGNCESSNYPEAANDVSKVGYQRMLPSEGIISLYPDVIFITDEAGPPSILEQLNHANIDIIQLQKAISLDGIYSNIHRISTRLNLKKKGEELVSKLKNTESVLENKVKLLEKAPRVLFVLGHGGVARVAGKETAADSMIELSGGINVANQFKGYKPVSPEQFVKLDPDYILTTSIGVDAKGGIEKFCNMPGIRQTRAVKDNNILIFDAQYLLGFGPRTVQAALELNSRFNK